LPDYEEPHLRPWVVHQQLYTVNGVQTPKHLTTRGIKSDPTFSTSAKCLSPLTTFPTAAATPAQEAEEDIKAG